MNNEKTYHIFNEVFGGGLMASTSKTEIVKLVRAMDLACEASKKDDDDEIIPVPISIQIQLGRRG